MPQSLSKIVLHLIFSTEGRVPTIRDADRAEAGAYATGVMSNHGCASIRTTVMPDHVHVLFLLGRTVAVADVVRELKTGLTAWFRRRDASYGGFAWQRGYGAFSVSESVLPSAIRYVENQEQHHQRVSFQDEFRMFCEKHGVELDERYVWE